MVRLKRRQDSGSPCLTPLMTGYVSLQTQFMMTCIFACLYKVATVLMNTSGI